MSSTLEDEDAPPGAWRSAAGLVTIPFASLRSPHPGNSTGAGAALWPPGGWTELDQTR